MPLLRYLRYLYVCAAPAIILLQLQMLHALVVDSACGLVHA